MGVTMRTTATVRILVVDDKDGIGSKLGEDLKTQLLYRTIR